MQHLRWEKSCRTFTGDKPGQFVYKSSIGQQNIDLGNGQFAPYVWDKEKKIAKFADCELRFIETGLEFWHGKERLNALSFNPESKDKDSFVRKTASVSGLTTQEIDPGNSKVELKISYRITTEDSETEVFVRAGYNHKVHFGTRFKALKNGIEQRIALEFAEKFDPVEERDREGKILPTARLKTDKSWWAWNQEEQADHEIEQTTITKVHLGRKVYDLNEEKIISPDTWGTDVGLADASDDCFMESGQYYNHSSGILYLGTYGSPPNESVGLRWDGITISDGATIDTTYIDVYQEDVWQSGNVTVNVQAWDTQDAGQFSQENNPNNVTRTTAAVSWSITAGNLVWATSPNSNSVVQEILDSYGLDDEAINFILYGPATGNCLDLQAYEDAGTNEAELTITYTAGGADGRIGVGGIQSPRVGGRLESLISHFFH